VGQLCAGVANRSVRRCMRGAGRGAFTVRVLGGGRELGFGCARHCVGMGGEIRGQESLPIRGKGGEAAGGGYGGEGRLLGGELMGDTLC